MSINVGIKPVWLLGTEGSPAREFQILELLQAINETGKLTQAAKLVGLSYRHAWDLIEQWGAFLKNPLVAKHQGRGVYLTPLGERLLWAEKRVTARLTAQLTNVASELEVEINRVLNETAQVVRLHASHGYAVAEMRELLQKGSGVQLDLQYRGSIDALTSLARGDCDLAGFHVPEGPLEAKALALFNRWINPKTDRIIHFVRRSQGFIIRRGNPHQITGIHDLTRPDIRFVNREPQSGTRMLLDMLLEDARIDVAAIAGYRREELTHNAVAALIASDMADMGFGVEAAARQFGLDFIPVAAEQYYLMCRQETLQKPGMEEILKLLQSSEFKRTIVAIPGYATQRSGEISTIGEIFPGLKA